MKQWGARRAFGQLMIGPGGENLVLYSAVLSGERAAGRTGVGAVFDWKNLKAIAATGNHEIRVAHPEKNEKWNQKWFQYLRKHPLTGNQLPRMGTAGLVSAMQMRGMLATKNYSAGRYDQFELVNGETLAEEQNIVNKGCLTCPIKCARTVDVKGREVKGPELETLVLLGGGICNDNLGDILRWNNELDELGLDTISCASTIAYAMEANEKGLWDNGLKFGETAGLSQLFEDIAHRRHPGGEGGAVHRLDRGYEGEDEHPRRRGRHRGQGRGADHHLGPEGGQPPLPGAGDLGQGGHGKARFHRPQRLI